jgi:hypothetical protein
MTGQRERRVLMALLMTFSLTGCGGMSKMRDILTDKSAAQSADCSAQVPAGSAKPASPPCPQKSAAKQ